MTSKIRRTKATKRTKIKKSEKIRGSRQSQTLTGGASRICYKSHCES